MLKINTKGMSHPCSQCKHAATNASDLKNQVENINKGVRYPGPECEYFASRTKQLKIHIEKKFKLKFTFQFKLIQIL